MSANDSRLTASLGEHPRLLGALFTLTLLLTLGTSTVVAGGGSGTIGGP